MPLGIRGCVVLAAAITALAGTGCAQRNEEDVRTGEALSRILKEQSILIEGQAELTARLGGRWDPLGLSRFIRKELDPATEEAIRESSRNIEMGAREEAADLTQSAEDLQEAGEKADRLLELFLSANTAPELIDPRAVTSNPPPPTPTEPLRDQIDSIERRSIALEESLTRSSASANRAFGSIERRLEETGNLEDQSRSQIDEGRDLANQLEGDSGLAAREFSSYIERYLSNILGIIEGAQARRSEGNCGKARVPYPSTLGEPFINLNADEPIACEWAIGAVIELYSSPGFRETGSGFIRWSAPSIGQSNCELEPIDARALPRTVVCTPEFIDESNLPLASKPGSGVVSFEAPATAG